MQQPPPDRSNKNPYAMPTAWPRPPETTFHLRVPKPPAGTKAAKSAPAAPPRPARPGSSILTGSALPVGYTAPQRPPEVAPVEAEAPVTPPVAESVREPEAAVEPAPDVAPAPPFIAPREAPFAAPRKARRRESRMPLIAGAVVTALVGIGAAAWLLLREPEPAALETTTIAPAVHEPVIVPPSFEGLMSESEAREAELGGPVEPVQNSAPARRTVTRAAQPRAAVELPSRPVPYSGDATPTIAIPNPPALVLPRPAPPPPPASAPGPQTPIADPDAPLTTRDPTSGD